MKSSRLRRNSWAAASARARARAVGARKQLVPPMYDVSLSN